MRRILLVVAVLACCLAATPSIAQRKDVPYGADDSYAHQLDIYVPAKRSTTGTVVFVHGGAFVEGGDRSEWAFVGRSLASQGIPAVIVSYRLFPETGTLGATRDVARAVAWLAQHPLYPDRPCIVLAGHSAGAHVVALLATDASLLRDAGVAEGTVYGAIADDGAYDLRDLSGEPDWMQKVDGHIFGETPQARARISPQLFAAASNLPIVAACGTRNDPGSCAHAIAFVRAVNAKGGNAIVLREVGADHMGMLRALITPSDPLNNLLRAVLANACARS